MKMRWLCLMMSVLILEMAHPTFVHAFCGQPNLLIVLDRSGSMNNANKWKDAKTAIGKITQTYGKQIRFGLETFSDSATINAKVPSTPAVINAALGKISPLGQTFMVKALTTARSHLISIISSDSSSGRPTQILFITDGEPSDRCPSAEVSALRKVTVKGTNYDIKTYVIGFGSLVNRICLNDMAVRGGTALPGSIRYYVSNNANDLVAAMKKIITDATNSAKREICDGKDNDCDGKVDEYLKQSCTSGGCRGTQTCTKGKWGTCSAPKPTAEICDNKDNDCDGKTDENLSKACKNQCGSGKQICSRGRWGACTPRPLREVCDGKDNDCDGQTDEGLTRNCVPCGTQTCSRGKWGTCVKGKPTAEICDNKDNNCDGKIDNFTRPCSNKCGKGTELCLSGRWRGCSARPRSEICDGKDNDCDGQTDENLVKICGKCATQTCSKGKWSKCVQGKASPEVCDNKDNDCDGKIDENLSKACKYRNCTGAQTCSRGRWSSCRPPVEKCDGKDNDCDGRIDENWRDKGKPCGSGVGICYRTGIFVCKSDGSGLVCNVTPGKPAAEVCDAKDNDCDGKSDEGLSRKCNAKCGAGIQYCREGSWTTCTATGGGKPTTEVCDAKDNDCDGKVDEGLSKPCKAKCGSGKQLCVKGKWGVCNPYNQRTPKPEVCDGIDNDCDGTTDEGLIKACQSTCGAGKQKCEKGKWGTCVPNSGQTPAKEVCNGKDDNCNGQIDENTYRPCKTACGQGRQACIRGDWSSCSAGEPRPEICNGKDDDCDGQVDEGASSCGSAHLCVKGACRSKCSGGECPKGQRCEKGYCVGLSCISVRCPDGYSCDKGTCVDACKNKTCPTKTVCQSGRCMPENCYAYGCPSAQHCVNGKCVADPCAKVNCKTDTYCREGKCITPCFCAPGQVCINDACAPKTCSSANCSGDKTCQEGKCVKKCLQTCHGGQYCKDGKCVHDPCTSITCPAGTTCRQGHCTNQPQDPEEPAIPENPGSEGSGSGDGNSHSEGNPSDTEPGTGVHTDDFSKPDGVVGGPSSGEDAGGHPENGGAGSDGCGCHTSSSPLSGWMGILLLFLLAMWRRKRFV